MHDGPDIGEVPLRDPEVEGTEGLTRHYPGPILQVSKSEIITRSTLLVNILQQNFMPLDPSPFIQIASTVIVMWPLLSFFNQFPLLNEKIIIIQIFFLSLFSVIYEHLYD